MSAQLSLEYFNTTAYAGSDLAARKARVATQNTEILGMFATYATLTPSDVHARLIARGFNWEITSIRRAITTLTKDGLLVKMPEMREGPRGAREHAWAAKGIG